MACRALTHPHGGLFQPLATAALGEGLRAFGGLEAEGDAVVGVAAAEAVGQGRNGVSPRSPARSRRSCARGRFRPAARHRAASRVSASRWWSRPCGSGVVIVSYGGT